jgi:hypothetical protein
MTDTQKIKEIKNLLKTALDSTGMVDLGSLVNNIRLIVHS